VQARVEINRLMAADVALLRQIKEIQKQTQLTFDYTRRLREELLIRVGSHDNAQKLADASIVEEVIFGQPNGSTQADSLQQRLVAYGKFIRPFISQQVPIHGLGITTNGTTEPSPVSYNEFYFRDASVAEALAVLAQQEAEVVRLELAALREQSSKMGSYDSFMIMRPFAVAEANAVKEGEPYRATLLLASSIAGFPMTMMANGRPVKVANNQGQVEFTVPVQEGRPEKTQAYWEASITAEVRGQDTTFRLRVPYTIYKK
jgi:hypothetical protein